MPDPTADDVAFAEAVGVKPSWLHHFASAKGMAAAFVAAIGAAFAAGRYLQALTLDVAQAKAEAHDARAAVAVAASAPDVPELRERVGRVEATAADLGLDVRATGAAVRRVEANVWISCVRVGGQKCLPPVSLTSP